MIWPERAIWFSTEPDAYDDHDLSSQSEHEDFGGLPGWAQVLLGDDTQDEGDFVLWEDPPGWVQSTAEPYVMPETAEANARRRDDAAARLSADGWEVDRDLPEIVVGRKGTILVEFWANDGGNVPSMDLYRLPPPAHGRLVPAGAVAGALAGVAGALVLARYRRRFPHSRVPGLVLAALGLLLINTVIVALVVCFDLDDSGHLDTPLWRAGRFAPLGASMNVAFLLLAVAGVAMVRRYRMNSSSRS